MNTEAIILAGGLGTRLRSVVADLPKCMASVAGKPFLYYVITHLQKEGVEKFIFSLGYKSEIIEAYIQQHFPKLEAQFSVEEEPLGTGGAIKLACKKGNTKNVLVLNGDTLFSVELQQLIAFHEFEQAACTLCLKPMQQFDRYGVVVLDDKHRIISFKEKQFYESGLINGGVYVLERSQFLSEALPEKFSFEKEYLEKQVGKQKMFGVVQDKYFIDIGIPEDFERAQVEFANVQL